MNEAETATLGKAGTIGALARWVLHPGPIPQTSLEHAALLVLDALGCGIAGLADPLAEVVRDLAAGSGEGVVSRRMTNRFDNSRPSQLMAPSSGGALTSWGATPSSRAESWSSVTGLREKSMIVRTALGCPSEKRSFNWSAR